MNNISRIVVAVEEWEAKRLFAGEIKESDQINIFWIFFLSIINIPNSFNIKVNNYSINLLRDTYRMNHAMKVLHACGE